MLKICYFLRSFTLIGGIERVVAAKANYLADVLGYDVTICTIEQRGLPQAFPLSAKVKLHDLDVQFYHPESATDKLQAYMKNARIVRHALEKYLNTERFDICISTEAGHDFLQLPYVHDGSIKLAEYHTSFKRKVYDLKQARGAGILQLVNRYWYWLFAARRYKYFVVLTQADKRNWDRLLPNVMVIPNPLDAGSYKPLSHDAKVCVAVGRFSYEKGMDLMLDAWAQAVAGGTGGWELWLYGGGAEEGNLRKQAEQLGIAGSVKFKGYAREMGAVYSAGAIFLSASRIEGFGLAIGEAQQAGLPAIAFSEAGPDDIIEDGVNGYIVKAGDTAAYAQQLSVLMGDAGMRKRMGTAGRDSVRRYAMDRVMGEWDELFKELAKGNNGKEKD